MAGETSTSTTADMQRHKTMASDKRIELMVIVADTYSTQTLV
jgi:hypothetical protein